MRGVICYYSGSGNTRLACDYLAARLGMEYDFVDVLADDSVDLAPYEIVGLAASTDFRGVPQRFESFLAQLPHQGGKPAFVLNTFGFASGRTLSGLAEQAEARGFTVIGGHSLRMPESYPPMIAIHLAFADRPNRQDLLGFDAFATWLREVLGRVRRGETVEAHKPRIGLLNSLVSSAARTTARDDMGEKFVDAELCTECGTCATRCPYGAIELSPAPVFDMTTCRGCWRCYNQCAQHAIYTKKFRGGPYYPRPSELTRETLQA